MVSNIKVFKTFRSQSRFFIYLFIFFFGGGGGGVDSQTGLNKAWPLSLCFFFRYLRDGMVLKKYAHCFAILMRLRQLCLHPSLCAKESESLQHAQNLLQGG